MAVPAEIARFLDGRRIVVAGVSRNPHHFANAIYRRLALLDYDVVPVNPRAPKVEDSVCYPDLLSVPGTIDGVIVAGPPAASLDLVRQSAARGVPRLWFHRSIGGGSVSPAAVAECRARGIACIVGGCPMMYCGPVDPGHRCLRALLRWTGRIHG